MSENNYQFDSNSFIPFVKKWKNTIITTSALAFVISLIFSLFITDKYKSSVILFPSTTSSLSRALLDNKSYKEKDYLEFGEEAEAEQMIQILSSDEIKHHIIEKFDLMNHYRIDPSEKFKVTKLNKMYDSNIKFYRTKFLSVKIEVLDQDAQYAADIANEIALMLDSVKNKILKKVAKQGYEIVKRTYEELRQEMKLMEDTLDYLRGKGIQDYEKQVEVYSDQYGAALVKNNARAAEILNKKLENLSEFGGKYLALSEQMEYERERLSDLRKVYQEAKVNAEAVIDQKFVVNHAVPSERPSYPIRWLIVVVSTLSTFLFTLIVLILIDPKK